MSESPKKQKGSNRVSLLSAKALSNASLHPPSVTTTQKLWKTRTADAVLAATGISGSLALLQWIQDHYYDQTPIVGGFLVGSAIKFFLNQSPPNLEAFFKSTVAGIVVGSSLHSVLWTVDDATKEPVPILSGVYCNHLILFCMILFWKLDVGSIWGAGNSLAAYIAFQSGYWGHNLSSTGEIRTLLEEFPTWYILRPYLVGHLYLYGCAMGMARIRRRLRIYLLRRETFSKQKRLIREDEGYVEELKADRCKLRVLFDRMDTSGDGRLDATELQLALRAAVGADLTPEDCRFLIRSVDCDGDGTIDFDEFCASVDQIFLL